MKNLQFWAETENEINKLINTLENIKAEGLTFSIDLSVKLSKINDLSEIKSISILAEGKRSADGSLTIRVPKNQKSDVPQSPKILKEELQGIEKAVDRYIMENALEKDWEEPKTALNEGMKSGLTTVDDLEREGELLFRALNQYGNEPHFCAPLMATAHAIEGAEALMKNDLALASRHVKRGLYWSSPDMFISDPKARLIEKAKLGGKAKALAWQPVKDKVAELMIALQPDGGWKTQSEAIDVVTDVLITKHSEFIEACGLTCNDLFRTIERWVSTNPDNYPYRIKP